MPAECAHHPAACFLRDRREAGLGFVRWPLGGTWLEQSHEHPRDSTGHVPRRPDASPRGRPSPHFSGIRWRTPGKPAQGSEAPMRSSRLSTPGTRSGPTDHKRSCLRPSRELGASHAGSSRNSGRASRRFPPGRHHPGAPSAGFTGTFPAAPAAAKLQGPLTASRALTCPRLTLFRTRGRQPAVASPR